MKTLRENLENLKNCAQIHGHLPLELEAAEALINVVLAALSDQDELEPDTAHPLLRTDDALSRLDRVLGEG